MASLTSYKFKNVELNDGTNYAIPLAGTSFDDPNSVDASWAYRKGDIPSQTGVTIKEGVFSIPIHIIAATASSYAAKLKTLKTIFNTRDPQHYALSRKKPHESVYSTLMVSPSEMVEDPIERKVIVTMRTPDKAWLEPTLQQSSITLFETAARTEYLTINYTGTTPVEPIITIQCLTEGHDGPRPLYYHDIAIWTQGAQHIVGEPILLLSGWDTSPMVADSEIRADGLDITVEFLDGTSVPRYIAGTTSARKIWIQPTAWPMRFDVVLGAPPAWNPLADPADPMLTSSDTEMYVTVWPGANPDASTFTTEFPTSQVVRIDDEWILYTGVVWLNTEKTLAKLTGLSRGYFGTTPADHYAFRRVLLPTVLRIRYGYPPPYENTLSKNNLYQWPLLDYELSTNQTWVQTATQTPYSGMTPLYRYGWGTWNKRSTATDKPYVGETITGMSIYGEEAFDRAAKQKLVGHNTGNDWTVTGHGWARLSLRFVASGGRRGRMFSYIKFHPKLLTSAGKTITCRAKVVRDNFGQYALGNGQWISIEEQEQLWVQNHTGATQTQYDSGWLYTGMWSKEVEAFCIEIDHCPAGTGPTDNLVLDKVEYLMDYEYAGWPVVGNLGPQQGGTQIALTAIKNTSDTQTATNFTMNTAMAPDDVVTIDCSLRTVTGALLKETAYRNPTWLRLIPGSNVIQFSGSPSVGQVLVTVKWYNHN
jgi:hypothetical protein